MQFFSLGLVKRKVNSTKRAILEELEGRLREVISAIPTKFLRSIDAIPDRLEKIKANGGRHIKF